MSHPTRHGWHGIERPPHKHLQHARLGKHKAPRAVAGYKRSSVALLLLRLPGRDTQARSGTGLAKTIRWVLYGGEAFREAKNNNAQPAMADSTERRAQHPAASREAANPSALMQGARVSINQKKRPHAAAMSGRAHHARAPWHEPWRCMRAFAVRQHRPARLAAPGQWPRARQHRPA